MLGPQESPSADTRFLSPVRPRQREVHAPLASNPGLLAGLQPQHPCQQLLITAGEPGAGGWGPGPGARPLQDPEEGRTAQAVPVSHAHFRCLQCFGAVLLARERWWACGMVSVAVRHACERSRCEPCAMRLVGPSAPCLRGPSLSAAGSPLVGSAARGHAVRGSPRPPGAAARTRSASEDMLVLGPHRVGLQQQRLVGSRRSSRAWV